MKVFRYEAVATDGSPVRGEIAARDDSTVRASLGERALTLLELKERKRRRIDLGRRGGGEDERIEFTRSMGSLVNAGIPLLQVLEDLRGQSESRTYRDLLGDVIVRIEGGGSVSESLAAHPEIFDDLYINIVRAGEESGKLPLAFDSLTEHLERSKAMKQELRRAFSYPVTVLAALLGFAALLTFFVFPRLEGLFETLEVGVPLPTRILLAVGGVGSRLLPAVLAAVFLGAIGWPRLRRYPPFRMLTDRIALNLPILGRIVKMAAFSRMAGTLATLLASGISLERALDLSQSSTGNRVIGRAIGAVLDWIRAGETFSGALARSGRFPQVVVRMAMVGESSGDLPGMLSNLSQHYDREMPNLFRKTIAAMTPLLIVGLVVMVGFAALAVFMPLMEVTSAIH
ncbi:MAG: type II secretion system F family protein [Candidatus Eisenbacteria bacterium]|nr:type II secretion system F family protein [Candidatus Eisenbacteria bacterium]